MSSRESDELDSLLWRPVVSFVEDIGIKLRAGFPSLTWTANSHPSRVFPFAGTIAFSRSGEPEDEDLVLTVHATRRDPWNWNVDLARGTGEVLAETDFTTETAGQEVSDAIKRFVQEHQSTLEEMLGPTT
jgi:hypothetical protein